MVHFTDQRDYAVRLEWGDRGLQALAAAGPSVFVIVDVLSFSSCVAVAVEQGAELLPYRWKDGSAVAYARAHQAILAGSRADANTEYSLSPESLLTIPSGARLVLPSPNGSTLSFMALDRGTVIAGSLRNRAAVSAFLNEQKMPVAIIAAGERWPDGSMRPCFEDLVGAGGIIAGLNGLRSPEAEASVAAYHAAAGHLRDALLQCSSGRELVDCGYRRDVEIAAEVDVSTCVPLLRGACFTQAGKRGRG
jgi:2-phosphosulfolactate phosphatase